MAPTRQSARVRISSTPIRDTAQDVPTTPKTTTCYSAINNSGDTVMTSESVLVPPSPSFFDGPQDHNNAPKDNSGLSIRRGNRTRTKSRKMLEADTGAKIKKEQPKTRIVTQKLMNAAAGATYATGDEDKQPFRFLELPGEIRNIIYARASDNPRQALLVHRPRVASLRSRTRLDRQRTLASDVMDKAIGNELVTTKSRRSSKHAASDVLARETNRPFFGLTQVCRQLRTEFRPIFLQKQEIGMDLTEIVRYLQTFYFDAPNKFAKLFEGDERGKDIPFTGNLTIAVGEKPLELERKKEGIEVIPLLDLWANSFKIEAGFGRYLKVGYQPQLDGEAKDLYRLFGRRVLKNRSCSSMNGLWRSVLRNRSLASVTLHRKPASTLVPLASLVPGAVRARALARIGPLLPVPTMVTVDAKPFIHILFHVECAELWMNQEVSDIPHGWLADHGFGKMEHFDVKVGVAAQGFDKRI